MIDHIVIGVRDYDASKAFYARALAALGAGLVMEFGSYGGFGRPGKPSLWITARPPSFWQAQHAAGTSPVHIAFTAADRASVDAFHREALAAGGKDYGPPGLRPHYHASYYGAFVLDLDGNDVEAVCHAPA